MRFDNHPNRQRALRPRSKRGRWCDHCDACLVQEIGKCRYCGRSCNKKKSHSKRRLKGY
jgi:hypothetical protein